MSCMRRPCARCDEFFSPTTRGNRICDDCKEKSTIERKRKIKEMRGRFKSK